MRGSGEDRRPEFGEEADLLTEAIDAKPFGGIMSRVGSVMSGHIPLLAAAGVLGLIPGAVLAILMRRHLAQGFSLGRVS